VHDRALNAVAGLSCRPNVEEELFAEAVSVAVCAENTAARAAVNVAVELPAATVTDDGTVTEVLLLAKPTTNPPVEAAVERVTVQESVPAAL